jgi:hypothetical protein
VNREKFKTTAEKIIRQRSAALDQSLFEGMTEANEKNGGKLTVREMVDIFNRSIGGSFLPTLKRKSENYSASSNAVNRLVATMRQMRMSGQVVVSPVEIARAMNVSRRQVAYLLKSAEQSGNVVKLEKGQYHLPKNFVAR